MLFGKESTENSDKISVIVTLYPEYDFAKKIGGDKLEIKLLLSSGMDSHTYEPSVKDMKTINDSDIFIYTGKQLEPWAETIIQSLENKNKIVDCSQNIDIINDDGHIWLNPQNAITMVDTICTALCEYDAKNSNYYKSNAENYKKELEKLDEDFEEELVGTETLVFGGEFAYTYFVDRYNLDYKTVYDSCGEEAEPSVSKVKEIIDYINENNISKVYYEELSEGRVAKMISEETSAKSEIFYTLHNVSQEQIDSGEDYISIMRKNLENLKGIK